MIDLNVVVLPEPLYPIRPKCSFFSRFKFKLLTARTFFPRHTKYVLYKFFIFVVKFILLLLLLLFVIKLFAFSPRLILLLESSFNLDYKLLLILLFKIILLVSICSE